MEHKLYYLSQTIESFPNLELNDVCQLLNIGEDEFLLLFIRDGKKILLKKDFLNEIDIKMTGDENEKKICDRCFKIKDTKTEFENNRIKKGGLITKRPSCRDCRKIKNGKSISRVDRTEWEKKKPKLGEIFICPICQKSSIGGVSKHVLDHNHHTGEVRGYLCESCNTGIGRFDDDKELVKNAIDWLS